MTGSGTFRERKLTLTLKNENGTFILQGDLDNANLTGSWRKEDDSLQGTWQLRQSTRHRRNGITSLGFAQGISPVGGWRQRLLRAIRTAGGL